eukprot:TsM_001018100 transcript=TsM_001018100 gene=TsM_001018100
MPPEVWVTSMWWIWQTLMSLVAFFFFFSYYYYYYYFLISCEGETRVCLVLQHTTPTQSTGLRRSATERQFVPPVDMSADGTEQLVNAELVRRNRLNDSRDVDLLKVRGGETVKVHADMRIRGLSLIDAMHRGW